MTAPFHVQLLGTRAPLLKESVERLGCSAEIIPSVNELSPQADVCLAWGVYAVIRSQFLRIPRLGICGFHESPLPKGRGFAPLQWTILNGDPQLAMSLFQMVEQIDAGPLIAQHVVPIARSDLLEDLRQKSVTLAKDMIGQHLLPLLTGEARLREQTGEPSFFRQRTVADSRLDSSRSLNDLWDLIRVCDNDEYPAWFEIDGVTYLLKRHRM